MQRESVLRNILWRGYRGTYSDKLIPREEAMKRAQMFASLIYDTAQASLSDFNPLNPFRSNPFTQIYLIGGAARGEMELEDFDLLFIVGDSIFGGSSDFAGSAKNERTTLGYERYSSDLERRLVRRWARQEAFHIRAWQYFFDKDAASILQGRYDGAPEEFCGDLLEPDFFFLPTNWEEGDCYWGRLFISKMCDVSEEEAPAIGATWKREMIPFDLEKREFLRTP